MKLKKNYSLKKLTTMKVGGPAKYFINVKKEKDLINAIDWADKNRIKRYIIGEGSNLIPSDQGFNGLIIKNEIRDANIRIHTNDTNKKIIVGAGENLTKFIFQLNRLGLAGMEKMAGIPGTVGGAIYGSAGAYGQEIKDNLVRVKILDVGGANIRWLSKKQCQFSYRESIFKKKDWIILGAEFKFKKGSPKELQKISKEIIKMRGQKYQPGLLCPGSFFKNIVINNMRPGPLRQRFLKRIDKTKIIHGKVPTGWLLEEVGAKGMRRGGVKVAGHHGNLIYNLGRGKTSEIVRMAKILKNRVKKKFGINLDEEIQYI